MRALRVVLFLGFALCSGIAAAELAGVATIGIAEDAQAVRVGVQQPVSIDWSFFRSPKVSTVVEYSLGYWHGDKSDKHSNNLVEAAVLPVIRYHPSGAAEVGLFFEAGIGAHLLSRTRIHDERRFGSAFQLGDVIGLGWRFGASRYELGLRLHHISNGGIQEPNQGINFLDLRFVAPF
jgi:hypothetical protein